MTKGQKARRALDGGAPPPKTTTAPAAPPPEGRLLYYWFNGQWNVVKMHRLARKWKGKERYVVKMYDAAEAEWKPRLVLAEMTQLVPAHLDRTQPEHWTECEECAAKHGVEFRPRPAPKRFPDDEQPQKRKRAGKA